MLGFAIAAHALLAGSTLADSSERRAGPRAAIAGCWPWSPWLRESSVAAAADDDRIAGARAVERTPPVGAHQGYDGHAATHPDAGAWAAVDSAAIPGGAVPPPGFFQGQTAQRYQMLFPALRRVSSGESWFAIDALARAYYLNDQRLRWSGQEATFGAEAILAPVARQQFGAWHTEVGGEFFVNQPFDGNILTDTAERRSYLGNFDPDVFELSELYLAIERGDWGLAFGKITTPFGRTHFPLYTNARVDAPFIRTESVLYRETGLLIHYRPGIFVGDVAIVNGSEDRDTNSAKALISRLALETSHWAVGASIKTQDGVGSEHHKYFNAHLGLDAMVRRGPVTLSAEVVHDEYGFRRPNFDPNDITWQRSIYYRDINKSLHEPVTGLGYYVDLSFYGTKWFGSLNYGQFHPEQIGHPQHDIVHRRGIIKVAYQMTPWFQWYSVTMIENDGYIAQAGQQRRGTFVLAGLQGRF